MSIFLSKLNIRDLVLVSKFDLLLSETELEMRGGSLGDQFKMIRSRYRLQKKADLYLGKNIEVVMYGSIYGSYDAKDRTRLGVYI